MEPRAPVLVGVAQKSQRVDDPADAREPIELMTEVARAAAEDAGAPELLRKVDAVRVVGGSWPYRDPGRLVAERLGLPAVRTATTDIGGNVAQELVLRSAADVQSGQHDVVLVCAAETMRTRRRDRRLGRKTRYQQEPEGAEPDERFSDGRPMLTKEEVAAGITSPIAFYALVETALRHRRGESAEQHLDRIARMWSSLSEVAARNPHAWTREPRKPEQIRDPGPNNRVVAHPYTKWMTSNIDVDQAVAVLLCSSESARVAGIAEDRRIHPWSGTRARDHWYPSEREHIDESPALRIAGRRALELAGLEPDGVDLVDIYSCFPSAVQVAQRELGIDESVVPTVTGGLTFAGGPFNSYVLHAIARMTECLRERPGSRGLVTGDGGYFTKHSFGVYSAEPPAEPFTFESPQAAIDALPRRSPAPTYRGTAEIEAYTVTARPDGSLDTAIVSALTPAGGRLFSKSADRATGESLLERDACGLPARVEMGRLLGVG